MHTIAMLLAALLFVALVLGLDQSYAGAGVRARLTHLRANWGSELGEVLLRSSRDTLLKERDSFIEAARTIAAKAESEGRDFTPEERTMVKSAFDSAKAVSDRLLEQAGDAELMANINALGLEPGELAKAADTKPGRGKSVGERFTGADEIVNYLKTIAPTGQVSEKTQVHTPAIQFAGMKDILAGETAANAGSLVQEQWLGLLDLGTFQRPLTVKDLITVGQTGSDVVKYARVNGFTSGAAPVAEAQGAEPFVAGAGQVEGKKPQSDIDIETITADVKTIAHWLPATKRALSDAAQLRTLIDNFLRYGLEEELEDQIITGNGAGENFDGVANVAGVQAQAWDTNLLVTTRKAKTKVRTVGRTNATAYVLNPEDNERIDLLRDDSGGAGTGQFLFGSPAGNQLQTLWGLPRVESEAVPAGTGYVGNWKMAVLWDREQAAIQATDSHADFFIRNLVAILAEMRAAFGVIRPKAFVEIDLTA
jgi:HK97 family phage major capsid protein